MVRASQVDVLALSTPWQCQVLVWLTSPLVGRQNRRVWDVVSSSAQGLLCGQLQKQPRHSGWFGTGSEGVSCWFGVKSGTIWLPNTC